MKKLFYFFTVLLVVAGALTACSSGSNPPPAPIPPQTPEQTPASTGNYTNISPPQLNAMLLNKDFVLVNVHIPYYREIAQTDMFIPFDKILDNLSQLPQDKNAKIVLYCRSGPMSTQAAETLVSLGYTNVFNLTGGMYAWKDQGLQLLEKVQ